ncbi:hypothetical protein MKW98_026961 [Papaver atlanticum]|uniref:Uncharacterized protein n=1 Tax=Papaver atlanticum TaxID=357466 RepID=A0AAD4SUT9_9MAGN|nr:hypothetical protein MKW98_026961 [Papaver atlanticum]
MVIIMQYPFWTLIPVNRDTCGTSGCLGYNFFDQDQGSKNKANKQRNKTNIVFAAIHFRGPQAKLNFSFSDYDNSNYNSSSGRQQLQEISHNSNVEKPKIDTYYQMVNLHFIFSMNMGKLFHYGNHCSLPL